MSFASLALHEKLQSALAEAGYENPTPVQAEAIPAVLEGQDLIVSAQTGTGKTAAFMLPALSRIAEDSRRPGRGPRVLVLTPTRELAQQVTTAAQKYGSQLKGLRTISVLGGMPFPAQNRLLERPYDILVATPGRLLDHMQRGRIVFERLELMILDEADRMLDMGFIEDVEMIASKTPPERQTLLFSATFEPRIARLAENLLKEPKRIEITSQTVRNENIEQKVYFADDLDHKKKLLMHLLADTEIQQAIVFAGTRADSEALADELGEFGHSVDALHGDMKQAARNRTLNGLRNGRTRVLVATDVAARGIDVPGITHVINYDLPKNAEDYVHRIGRTGRAGRSGIAASLVGPRDRGVLRRIEQFTDHRIDVTVIEGLEPQRRVDQDRPRRAKGFGDKPRWGNKDRQARDSRNERRDDRRPAPRRDDNFGNRAADSYGIRGGANTGSTEGFTTGYAPRQDQGFTPWRDKAAGNGGNGGFDGARREGGFAGRREGGFSERRDGGRRDGAGAGAGNGGGFRGQRQGGEGFRPRDGGNGGGFRGQGQQRDGGGFRSYARDERPEQSAQEVAVSYARPRRARNEGEAKPVVSQRPRQESFFDEI